MPVYFEFDIEVLVGGPRIYRRMQLHSDSTFLDLHNAIQAAGRWEDCHMWQFRAAERGRPGDVVAFCTDEPDPFEGTVMPEAGKVRLNDYFRRAGRKCFYNYDFGDDWWVGVAYKRKVESDEQFTRRLLAAERAFPPDDCGGEWGYFACLAAVADPAVAQLEGEFDPDMIEDRVEWLGEWSPDVDFESLKRSFDIERPAGGRRRRKR